MEVHINKHTLLHSAKSNFIYNNNRKSIGVDIKKIFLLNGDYLKSLLNESFFWFSPFLLNCYYYVCNITTQVNHFAFKLANQNFILPQNIFNFTYNINININIEEILINDLRIKRKIQLFPSPQHLPLPFHNYCPFFTLLVIMDNWKAEIKYARGSISLVLYRI